MEARESSVNELKMRLMEMDDLINQNQHELYEIKNAISMKEKTSNLPAIRFR